MNDTTTCTTIPADIPGLVTFSPADGATLLIGGVRVAVLYFATMGDGEPTPVIDVKEA